MPYVSRAQEKYFNVNRAKLEKQGVNVDEWNHASKGLKLPKHVKHKEMKALREHYLLATGRLKVPKVGNIQTKHKTMENSHQKHTSAHDMMSHAEMMKNHSHKMHPAHKSHPMHKHYKAATENVRHMDGTHHTMEMRPSHEK